MCSSDLDAVDIGAIVRESTGSVTGDMVDSARIQSMQLDVVVNRIVDTILLRRRRERAHLGDGWDRSRGGDAPTDPADGAAPAGEDDA